MNTRRRCHGLIQQGAGLIDGEEALLSALNGSPAAAPAQPERLHRPCGTCRAPSPPARRQSVQPTPAARPGPRAAKQAHGLASRSALIHSCQSRFATRWRALRFTIRTSEPSRHRRADAPDRLGWDPFFLERAQRCLEMDTGSTSQRLLDEELAGRLSRLPGAAGSASDEARQTTPGVRHPVDAGLMPKAKPRPRHGETDHRFKAPPVQKAHEARLSSHMFDVLVYLYENYWRHDACPDQDQLARKLKSAGFERDEIHEALNWLDGFAETARTYTGDQSPTGMRVFTRQEQEHLGEDSLGFLSFESAGVLPAKTRELVMDRAMAVEASPIPLEDLKIII